MNEENGKTPGTGPDPISLLLEAAISVHEMFLNFQAAGFTEQQALYLVAQGLRPQANGS